MLLECVISPLLEALQAEGLSAVRAYPKQPLDEKNDTLVCLSILRAEHLPAGMGAYLGLKTDPATGLCGEIYGSRCELELAADIYTAENTPDASTECMRCAESIARAVRLLPEGLKVSSISLGPVSADPETGRFSCRARLTASAFFIARALGEDGVFSDFILKGSVK